MCEANVYLISRGEEQMVMESVDTIVPAENETWHLISIFGEQKIIKGRIKSMNLVDHKILFENPG